ncbi:MAG: N-6 DNA methylase, partial [Planctomycetota bacterium]
MWRQEENGPSLFYGADEGSLDDFFRTYKASLDPRSLFRAKSRASHTPDDQLTFVDVGLLESVEAESGDQLCRLVERMILTTREKLEMAELKDLEEMDAQWLVKSNFWLLAARLLHDKQVPGFKRLNLDDLDNVFKRVGKHYGAHMPHALNQRRRRALSAAIRDLDSQRSLRLVSTETLARVYENVLITKETRKALGTHSTPAWLVDYMVDQLAPWIEELPVTRRHVYEPACGHGPFLVGMLRLLSSTKPCTQMEDGDRHQWLRQRLVGDEVDDFAREVAQLSLTLADIPNPNGWGLNDGNMFDNEVLAKRISEADIIFSNPPFETRQSGENELFHVGQAAELLRQISLYAKPGTLLAYIMPQTILDSKKTESLRQELLANFEWKVILRLPDKVFDKADVETAILVGRKHSNKKTKLAPIYCMHVWDGEVERFQLSSSATFEQQRLPSQMLSATNSSMLVPDLIELWDHCSRFGKLADVATAGQGFIFRSENDEKFPKGKPKTVETKTKGYEIGFFDMKSPTLSHLLPPLTWMLRDRRAIRRPVAGYETGLSQVVMNHARVGRGPWRNVAYVDSKGHPTRGRFLVVRSTCDKFSNLAIWALLNSPLANSFTKSFSSKRDILSGTLLELPVPPYAASQLREIEESAQAYINAANATRNLITKPRKTKRKTGSALVPSLPGMEEFEAPIQTELESLKYLHWRMDAAVLRLYQFPPKLERRLLDYFSNHQRVNSLSGGERNRLLLARVFSKPSNLLV